ncbi:MAG: TIGR00645 family protein [Methylophilus sp.]
MQEIQKPSATEYKQSSIMSNILFGSRWLQLPLYLGLIVAQAVYVYFFAVELVHLVGKTAVLKEADIMLIVLGLIDVVMISNLLIMVIVGGYETFVSRLNLEGHPDEPDWLSHVNANLLKVKLATAIIGISSIHLLKTFINAENLSQHVLMWQTIIHMAFIFSAVSIAYIDKLMNDASAKH